ncbi:MAG: hypothetical protein MRJ96_11100 [Nitrospirales bacterium]|nr:hypothetical protein [Nitrospira sp.]MDR4501987.1 hypothetical protein [Nitrospirales bacterium]
MTTDRLLLLIDAHVHLYDCYDLPIFLESALKNCRAQTDTLRHNGPILGILLLTEISCDHWFQRLRAFAEENRTLTHHSGKTWSFHRTEEEVTILANSSQGERILFVAGRQMATREKFEVLALITKESFQDGMSLHESIDRVKKSGGIPVIPWAFGKWWGARGKLLNEFMQSSAMTNVYVGDNGSRPGFLPYPPQFTLACEQGIRILPGSDPLPIHSESSKPCSVGLSLFAELDEQKPGATLKRLLQEANTPISPYFQHESCYRFFKNQVALRMQKSRAT